MTLPPPSRTPESRLGGPKLAGPDSDIDLLVRFSDVADPNRRAAELYASLIDFPSPMDIIVSTSSRFERYRNVVNTVYWPASREGRILYERAA